MPKIEKLPSGRYRMRVYDGKAKKSKSFTADSKKEVKQMAAEWMAGVMPSGSDITVADAIERYISSRSAVLSPSTIRGYRKLQHLYYEAVADYAAGSVGADTVQRWINDLSRTQSPKSIRNIYALFSSAVSAACSGRSFAVSLPQKKPVERHIPTDDAVKALIADASGDLRKAILLASIGTLRRGECCALTYADISGNTIHISKDMVEGASGGWVIKDTPKNSSSDRYIEFPEAVIKELGSGGGNERIIQLNPNMLSQRFSRLRDKHGLSCRFHDLRHYAASIMHAIGIPDQYIMERGGWSSDAILKSVYRNVLDDKRKEFSDRVNGYLSGLI